MSIHQHRGELRSCRLDADRTLAKREGQPPSLHLTKRLSPLGRKITWRINIRTSTLIIELTKKINRPGTESISVFSLTIYGVNLWKKDLI